MDLVRDVPRRPLPNKLRSKESTRVVKRVGLLQHPLLAVY